MRTNGNQRYDYDDVHLIPRVISTVESRSLIKFDLNFCGWKLSCPIIASPMSDVCNGTVASIMSYFGGFGIIHRFMPIVEQVNEYRKGKICGAALSINDKSSERPWALYDAGCRIFVLDVANGYHKSVGDFVTKFSDVYKDVKLIVGNVASEEGFDYLQNLPNVHGIRVGIAGGAACTTKHATGIYYPNFSLIQECSRIKRDGIALIADGGIKSAADISKAIFAGADFVMLGRLISSTKDSPAKRVMKGGVSHIKYSGSASQEIQLIYKQIPRYIEGQTLLFEEENISLIDRLTQLMDGLYSAMSYMDAYNFKEFRENTDWCTR